MKKTEIKRGTESSKIYRYGNCELKWNTAKKIWEILYKGEWQNEKSSISACREWIRAQRLKGFYPWHIK